MIVSERSSVEMCAFNFSLFTQLVSPRRRLCLLRSCCTFADASDYALAGSAGEGQDQRPISETRQRPT